MVHVSPHGGTSGGGGDSAWDVIKVWLIIAAIIGVIGVIIWMWG